MRIFQSPWTKLVTWWNTYLKVNTKVVSKWRRKWALKAEVRVLMENKTSLAFSYGKTYLFLITLTLWWHKTTLQVLCHTAEKSHFFFCLTTIWNDGPLRKHELRNRMWLYITRFSYNFRSLIDVYRCSSSKQKLLLMRELRFLNYCVFFFFFEELMESKFNEKCIRRFNVYFPAIFQTKQRVKRIHNDGVRLQRVDSPVAASAHDQPLLRHNSHISRTPKVSAANARWI